LPDMRNCGFTGRARTFEWTEINYVDEENPYGLEIEAMDSLNAGDVVIHSTDQNGTNAPWGELMSTIAKRKGVSGCVCDSQVRDCIKIIEMDFPVYYSGIRPLDSKGRGLVTAYDVPVQCGDVLVNPGDLIFADFDGIVVIPKAIEKEVTQKAREKVHAENLSRGELLQGKTLREVYDKYQAL
jgi:4-hydroxy-4-methyl-2-oxoglutarate aldolase